MNNEIKIVSDAFTAEELKELLNKELPKSEISLELKENPKGTMALDPTTLVALATIGSTVLTTLVTQLFGLWQKSLENKIKSEENRIKLETATVTIKLAGGGELVIPKSIADNSEKLENLLKTIEGKPVKQVGLITQP